MKIVLYLTFTKITVHIDRELDQGYRVPELRELIEN